MRDPVEIPLCPNCGGEGRPTPERLRRYNLARYECLEPRCNSYYVGTTREWDELAYRRERAQQWKADAE